MLFFLLAGQAVFNSASEPFLGECLNSILNWRLYLNIEKMHTISIFNIGVFSYLTYDK